MYNQKCPMLAQQNTTDEQTIIAELARGFSLDAAQRNEVCHKTISWIEQIRAVEQPGLMEEFMSNYDLSSDEGVALMSLAEALLRVPDEATMDLLISDKLATYHWLSKEGTLFFKGASMALAASSIVVKQDTKNILQDIVRRLGAPVVRVAVIAQMRLMGRQFVLGENIAQALNRATIMEKRGYNYSFDMLGEGARTAADAKNYLNAYSEAIESIGQSAAKNKNIDSQQHHSISVKLSALMPRYQTAQREQVLTLLPPRLLMLACAAAKYNIGLSVDAEETARLELSLEVIEATLSSPELAGWDGFGIVLQAYQRVADSVIEHVAMLAKKYKRRIAVRLVKGAYWDSEIKIAHEKGVIDFPVFTRKAHTDIAYLCLAEKLLAMEDYIYPQFATHNAHTMAGILALAKGNKNFEFQRLHGMGEQLHDIVKKECGGRFRIYAPVGSHSDLLAYLVRRLLENGANSSFVHQISNPQIPPAEIAVDPFAALNKTPSNSIPKPPDLFLPTYTNSKGWDLDNPLTLMEVQKEREIWRTHQWQATPLIAGVDVVLQTKTNLPVYNPAIPQETVGFVSTATALLAKEALAAATPWQATADCRADILTNAAALYEQHAFELFALLSREAGKTLDDAVAEVREAVSFLRYYAAQIRTKALLPRGCAVCISPWNFPLAIFTGQLAAALAAGNTVIAKPAEQTPLIAMRAVQLLHQAGVPTNALQLLPGDGALLGEALLSDNRCALTVFTGGMDTATIINRRLADCAPAAPLIAETGGLNAMIVDATALLERAVDDIIMSAYRSAGQRCSALRILYVQEDIADQLLPMLIGAMQELIIGEPWQIKTDVGPLISKEAQQQIFDYINTHRQKVIAEMSPPKEGYFVAPTLLEVNNISDLPGEVFGPILHVVRFAAADIEQVVTDINNAGYGLTFGIHTRISHRAQAISAAIDVGNVYVNRNQIGAVVGSQPFGGHGLSGTGPKAGGCFYVNRMSNNASNIKTTTTQHSDSATTPISSTQIMEALKKLAAPCLATASSVMPEQQLPGPAGEDNCWVCLPQGVVLCLGEDAHTLTAQVEAAIATGNQVVAIAPQAIPATENIDGKERLAVLEGCIDFACLESLPLDVVLFAGDEGVSHKIRRHLAARKGKIIPLFANNNAEQLLREKHVCTDTTSSGGNARLMAMII